MGQGLRLEHKNISGSSQSLLTEEEILRRGISHVVLGVFGEQWKKNQGALNLRLRLQSQVSAGNEEAVMLVRQANQLSDAGALVSETLCGRETWGWLQVQKNLALAGKVEITKSENSWPEHIGRREPKKNIDVMRSRVHELLEFAPIKLREKIEKEMCKWCENEDNLTKWLKMLEPVQIPKQRTDGPPRTDTKKVMQNSPCRRVANLLSHMMNTTAIPEEGFDRLSSVLQKQLVLNIQEDFNYALKSRRVSGQVRKVLEEVCKIDMRNKNIIISPKNGHTWHEVGCVVAQLFWFRELEGRHGGGGGHVGGNC